MAQKLLLHDSSDAIEQSLRAQFDCQSLSILRVLESEPVLEIVSSYQPDVIVVNTRAASSGLDLCRELKASASTTHVPVLILAHSPTAMERVAALDLGAMDCLSDDCHPLELSARVRGALRMKYLLDVLAHKAMLDGLTGVWNRAYFEARLAAEVSLARRSLIPLSLIMVDIDHFKRLNDTHGHVFGDEVLRGVGQRLAEMARAEDIVCRYGGEEFALITPSTAAAAATGLAERVGDAVRALRWPPQGQPVAITCSLGVAEYHPQFNSSLVARADHALYQAKQWGRNRVVVADPVDSQPTDPIAPNRAA